MRVRTEAPRLDSTTEQVAESMLTLLHVLSADGRAKIRVFLLDRSEVAEYRELLTVMNDFERATDWNARVSR